MSATKAKQCTPPTFTLADNGVWPSYERLLMQQPHIAVRGLWQLAGMFWIECPGLTADTKTLDGEAITEWFDSHCRVVCAPVRLVAVPPAGAVPAAERSLEDIVLMRADFRNTRDVLADLIISLPKEFPNFDVPHRNDGAIHVVFERALTTEETSIFRQTYEELGLHTNLIVEVDPQLSPEPFRHPTTIAHALPPDMDLLPSKRLPPETPRELRWLVDEDEQFWADNRLAVFGTRALPVDSILSPDWHSQRSRCLVNPASRAHNIRNALTLYDEVLLVAPTAKRFEIVCHDLGVSSAELAELARLGRLRLLLPEALDRYPAALIAEIAESAPGCLQLSRRLAGAAVVTLRDRFPFLFPPLGMRERRLLLEGLFAAGQSAKDEATRQLFTAMSHSLGEAWLGAESILGRVGAAATPMLGLAPIIAAVAGRGAIDALIDPAATVEWAAPFGAHVFPQLGNDGREECGTDLMASLYSGTDPSATQVVPIRAHSVIDGVLSIDHGADVVEFAQALGHADIKRFRQLVYRIARENVDPDFLNDAIRRFNVEVRSYERRAGRIRTWNIIGLAGVLAPLIASTVPASAGDMTTKLVPVGVWMLQFMAVLLAEEYAHTLAPVGHLLDAANARLAGSSPDAALVCRMRQALK